MILVPLHGATRRWRFRASVAFAAASRRPFHAARKLSAVSDQPSATQDPEHVWQPQCCSCLQGESRATVLSSSL